MIIRWHVYIALYSLYRLFFAIIPSEKIVQRREMKDGSKLHKLVIGSRGEKWHYVDKPFSIRDNVNP